MWRQAINICHKGTRIVSRFVTQQNITRILISVNVMIVETNRLSDKACIHLIIRHQHSLFLLLRQRIMYSH